MRITYTAPFRISFSLTKQEALARHDRFIEIVETARTNLEESKQPTAKSRLPDNTRLGNYGWGLYNPRRQNVPRHGEKGIDDPTWFFRDFYTLSFGGRLDATGMLDLSDDPVTLKLFGTAQELSWECWLVDNTVAVLILNAEVPFSAFAACLEETVARETSLQMIEYGERLV